MKKKVLCICLILVLAVGGVFTYFSLTGLKTKTKLKYDYEKGAVAAAIVENAQYTPDIDKYIAIKNGTLSPASVNENATLDDFNALVDEYARVENYAGAGKYLGYDIYEIKDEIKFVVENVPAFNQWFEMPSMREEQGYVNIPYYELWSYYLEMNDDVLSITRFCAPTRSSYLDFENQKTVEDYFADGTTGNGNYYNENGLYSGDYLDKNGKRKEKVASFIQFEVMKINYYTDTNGKEVVETYFYSVGVDHASESWGFHDNTNDYYPFEYQYMKNVQDTSLIKYHITAAEIYRNRDSFDQGGMDIRGLNPYGVRREFLMADYDGYQSIDMTEIDQKFATLDNPSADGSVSFDLSSNNIQMLVKSVGLSNAKYTAATSAYDLMDLIAKQIIDNYELKNQWVDLYRNKCDGTKVEMIKGPCYGQKMPISDVDVYVETLPSLNGFEFTCDVNADVYDQDQLNVNQEYSLSLALKERTTGKIYIVDTDYQKPCSVNYAGSDTEYYYRFNGNSYSYENWTLNIDTDGMYDITCVLTEKQNGKDVIIFDPCVIGYCRRYYGLTIPNSVDSNGVTHKYAVKGTGGKITITVSSDK